jgi:hypothetical protein
MSKGSPLTRHALGASSASESQRANPKRAILPQDLCRRLQGGHIINQYDPPAYEFVESSDFKSFAKLFVALLARGSLLLL